MILAITSLVAVQFDITTPAGYADRTFALMWAYILYSCLILLWQTALRAPTNRIFGHVTVVIDLGLDHNHLPRFTGCKHSVLSVFRSNFLSGGIPIRIARYALGSTRAAAGCCSREAVVFRSISTLPMDLLQGPYEPNRLTLRAAYLFFMAWLVGYLAEAENQLRAETSFIASLNQKVQQAPGMEEALHAIFGELLQLYQAEKIRVVGFQRSTQKLLLVESDRTSGELRFQLRFSELQLKMRDIFLFPAPVECWQAVAHEKGLKLLSLAGDGEKISADSWSIPRAFLTDIRFAPFLAATISLGDEWMGRIFVQNSSDLGDKGTGLRFLQKFARGE